MLRNQSSGRHHMIKDGHVSRSSSGFDDIMLIEARTKCELYQNNANSKVNQKKTSMPRLN